MAIKIHIGNATGELNHLTGTINDAYRIANKYIKTHLGVLKIDIFVVNDAFSTIPEFGIGGYSPSDCVVYIYIDKDRKKIDTKTLASQMIHELHHSARWGKIGYGETLGAALVSEGLACLIEEEFTGEVPLYAKLSVPPHITEVALKSLNKKTYDHAKWFFGTGNLPRWIGYGLGYQICKRYSAHNKMSAAHLAGVDAEKILLFYFGNNIDED